MTLTALARNYFRYYDKINSNTFRLADNAPRDWHTFVGCLAPAQRRLVPVVLEQIINRTAYPALELEEYLNWVSTTPSWVSRMDNILSQKTPTKSFMELLDKAYRFELRLTKDMVTNFLDATLTS